MKGGSVRGAFGAITITLAAMVPAWSQEVRILKQDDRSVVLSVASPRPELAPHSGQRGSVEAKIPGSAMFAEESLPRLPYSRALIGVTEGTRPVLTILSAPESRISDERLMV